MMLTITQAAKILNLSRQHVHVLVQKGEIKAKVIPGGKYNTYRISEKALERYIAYRAKHPDKHRKP